jgi:flagellar protein FliJ
MPADPKKLARILRVRTLQLGLVRAEEARANDRVASELALRDRIARLADAVAPAPSAAPAEAMSFAAAAHYRERLHASAQAAEDRVTNAHRGLAHAQAATREAKRDQSAVEKLIARADHAAALRAIRALEDLPPSRAPNRHDPC